MKEGCIQTVDPAKSPQRRDFLKVLATSTTSLALVNLVACSSQEAAPEAGFTLLDGSQGTISGLRGKVLLVNFWATSCASCVAEMPELVAAHERFKARGYETLAVAMSYDPPAYVTAFVERRKLPFAVAIDNTGAISRAFGDIRLTPTSFLIDKSGRIVKRYVGPPDFAAYNALVEKLLAQA